MSPAYELVEGQPQLRDSVVLFLDILGSQDWSTGPEAQTYLNILHKALNQSRAMLKPSAAGTFATLWFTDNIVVGCPLDDPDDVEASLGLVSLLSGIFQAELATSSIFARGGISCGQLYMDEYMAFGPALVDSYNLEKYVAIYPRIVLSDALALHAKRHSVSYLGAAELPANKQNADCLITADNKCFLNYLDVLPSISDIEPALVFGAHKKAIEDCLEKFAGRPKVWAKYCWLADYHDFIVTRSGHLDRRVTTPSRNASFGVFYSTDTLESD